MAKREIDVARIVRELSALTIFALRHEWRRLHQAPPPKRLSRELLMRGITYQLQVRALGGLSKADLRRLAAVDAAPGTAAKPRTPTIAKPGTRLVREWGGATHTVLVLADGVEWQGNRYRSLTEIARKITGARWSGPRFFGLRPGKAGSKSATDADA